MAEESEATGLDAVEVGPIESDEPPPPAAVLGGVAPEDASVTALEARFGEGVLRHEVSAGDQHVVFVDGSTSLEMLSWLKDDPAQSYDLLADLTAVDFGKGRPIEIVYQLWSITRRVALRVKCELPLSALEIDSVVPLWQAANWLEREVYDMFGVAFRGHPDLRRILMPEDYAEGHPLRKDFPLRGRFSRAEQTRRALNRDPVHFYNREELEMGRDPQLPSDLEEGAEADPLAGAGDGG